MTLLILEKSLHERYLTVLNIFRFIRQEAFQQAYRVSTEIERTKARELIDVNDLTSITLWTKQALKKYSQYDYLDVRYIRDLAQERGVRYYASMTRIELINNLIKLDQESLTSTTKEENNVQATH